MRVTVPIRDSLMHALIRPEPIYLKYGTAQGEGGRTAFAIQFKDRRPKVKGDRDTEFSDFNRFHDYFDQTKEKPYALWINAMTIIVGRGEPPAIPAESFAEGQAANRTILNWVETRCIVIHMEDQGGVQLMQNMFPYPDARPLGTEPWVGWLKNGDFGLCLKTLPGFIEPSNENDESLFTDVALRKLKVEALADMAVRQGIIDAMPTWSRDRLVSEILAQYKKNQQLDTVEAK